MNTLFWTSWDDLFHTLIVGILGFIGIVLLFRISGKRTLSKFNSFDFVVTIAFGSLLAALMLNTSIALAQGLTAIGLLIALQWITTRLSTMNKTFDNLIKSEPSILFYRGQFLDHIMYRERFVREEVYSAIRNAGLASTQDVFAVVLETQGTLTVVPNSENKDQEPNAFQGVLNAKDVGLR